MEKVEVILVDEQDRVLGSMEKLEAHQKGLLHRAFSIFIFNSKQELLIHKRALGKYHSEGLWTNTCCSHPIPNESIIVAAHRRLKEEMGFDCKMKKCFSFIYDVCLDNQLIEHELDHVILGTYDGIPNINYEEASEYKWISIPELIENIHQTPKQYTHWFKIILNGHIDKIINELKKYESL